MNTFAAGPQGNATSFGASRAARVVAANPSTYAVWFEVAPVFSAIMAAVWTPVGLANTAANLVAILSICWFTLRGSFTARQIGLTFPLAGTLIPIAVGIGFAALIAATGYFLCRTFGPPHSVPWPRAWQYVVWSVVQEFILQAFFYLRLRSVLGSRRAVWWAAILFAVVHLPSPLLTVLAFFGGVIFCELFNRYRALIPIGLAHGLLGLTIAATMPDSILHHMRVGIGYLTYHP
ncbi:MAG TPA: CPBP family intramembrane glutamic endopeptidase [Terriglobales bacterium]